MRTDVFLSTHEKQLDAKRRLQLPHDFRTAENGAETGIYCMASLEADCIEAGGEAFVAEYRAFIDSLSFADPLRGELEEQVFGGLKQLSYDTAGRITLTDALVASGGLSQDVTIVGKGRSFQIWDRARWDARRAEKRPLVRAAMRELGEARRLAELARKGGG